MTTLALIKEAILALKERTGSSTSAINKYLLGEKQVRRFLQKLYRFFPSVELAAQRSFFGCHLTESSKLWHS